MKNNKNLIWVLRELRTTLGKRGSTVGSPCWMAPELVTSEQRSVKIGHDVYDNRVDTWALGMTLKIILQ